MGLVKNWIIAIRPFALPIFFLLPIAGYSLQYGINAIGWDIILVATGTVFMGIFVHLYNNYDDYMNGVDKIEAGSKAKAYTSASQLIPQGKIKPNSMLAGALFALAIAVATGGFILASHLWGIIAGVAGFIFAASYNVFKFKYKALGGVSFAGAAASALIFGATLNTLSINTEVWLMAAWITYIGFMTVNIDNYYDIESDRKNGVITFPMLHPRAFTYIVVGFLPVTIIIGIVFVVLAPFRAIAYIILLMMVMIAIAIYKALKEEKFMGIAVVGITVLLILILWW